MSWVYLPGPAEDCLPPNTYSGGEPSAPSRSTPTASASSRSGSATASSAPSPYGTISARSTVSRGEAWLTSFRAGSLARISQARGAAQGSVASARVCGLKCSELLARCGLRMSLPKTPRCFALAGWTSSSQGLPTWGLMLRGACSELGTSVRPIAATGCGSLLPTPTGAGNEGSPSMQKWPAHRALARMLPTCTTTDHKGATKRSGHGKPHGGPRLSPELAAERGWLPTPRASDAGRGGRGELLAVVRGKVPRARDAHLYFPTPTAQDARAGVSPHPNYKSLAKTWAEAGHGKNPSDRGGMFIALREWMMGWPIGWVGSQPLGTDRFQLWLRSHGVSSPRHWLDAFRATLRGGK